jgi:hypothetical protein
MKKANKDMQLLLSNNKKGQGAAIDTTNYYHHHHHHSVLNDARLSQVRVAYSEVPSCSIGDSYNNLKQIMNLPPVSLSNSRTII